MKAWKRSFNRMGQAESLLVWRWWILIISAVVAMLVELAEGHFRSIDLPLAAELFTFAILIPALSWFLLTALAHGLARRAESEAELARHRRFTRGLARCHDWAELVDFVTRFPAADAPIQHTALYLYDHKSVQMQFAAQWRAGNAQAPPEAAADFDPCLPCPLLNYPKDNPVVLCHAPSGAAGRHRVGVACLPLALDGLLVGALRVQCQPGARLEPEQVRWLEAVSPEIALAVARWVARQDLLTQARGQAQQDERRQIAYTLHNALAQQISYLHLSLDRLAGNSERAEAAVIQQELEHMRQAAGEAYEQVRGILSFLTAPEQAGLPEALTTLAESASWRTGLSIAVENCGEPRTLPPNAAQRLLAVVQEGLNNVQKHAGARSVRIQLDWQDYELRLQLADDGAGFDSGRAARPGHLGLVLMREQMEALGGSLRLSSQAGQGTQLEVVVPLAASEK